MQSTYMICICFNTCMFPDSKKLEPLPRLSCTPLAGFVCMCSEGEWGVPVFT